jgi:hypothetical protein
MQGQLRSTARVATTDHVDRLDGGGRVVGDAGPHSGRLTPDLPLRTVIR